MSRSMFDNVKNHLRHINFKPAQLITVSFLAIILISAFLLHLPIAAKNGESLKFIDCFFTAASATCVTGLVVVDIASTFTQFGQIVILLLIQIGGLGLMTIGVTIFLILGKRIGMRNRIALQESYNQLSFAGTVKLVKHVIFITLLAEALGALVLTLRFSANMPISQAIYYGIFHSISGFCNSGIDLFGTISGPFSSLALYGKDIIITGTLMLLITLGGLGFPVIMDLVTQKKTGKYSLHTKIVLLMTAILLVSGTIFFFIIERNNPESIAGMPTAQKILFSAFYSVISRTAGFIQLNVGALRTATLFFTIILMFIGVSPNSTGGGIKTSAFCVLLTNVFSTIRGKSETVIFRKKIPSDIINKAMTLFFISSALILGFTMLLTLTENLDFLTLLFEVTSALGTSGLSTGVTPDFSVAGKLIISLVMFIGRIGPLTFGMAVTVKKSPRSDLIRYSEEKVIIG